MTEIPEDVMRAAVVAFNTAIDMDGYEGSYEVIALAILAERERCCSVLRSLHEQQNGETFDTKYLDIEEIIRNGA